MGVNPSVETVFNGHTAGRYRCIYVSSAIRMAKLYTHATEESMADKIFRPTIAKLKEKH